MSDSGLSEVQGAPAELGPTSELSAGAMIRNAREAAGLHVAALAVSMKIPVKKLEALEADRLDLLHDAVFVRALAASVCRALKIDPAPVLNKLPLNQIPRLNSVERGINAPFQSQSGGTGLSVMAVLSKPSAMLVIVLILAGVGLKFLPEFKLPEWPTEASTLANKSPETTEQSQPAQPAPPAPEVVGAGAESPSATTRVPNVASKPDEAPPAPSAAAVASSDVQAPKVPAPALMVAPAVVAAREPVASASKPLAVASRPALAVSQALAAASRPSSAPVLPSTGMVVFKAKGPTWVKVVDAKGVVQLSKMLASGDVVGASGAPPLAVVIGRVDVTDVEVRGQAYPLTATSKDNVARFEVK